MSAVVNIITGGVHNGNHQTHTSKEQILFCGGGISLSCKFDEHTMKPLEDAKGRMIMRDNFLIEGINCEVDTFGAECIEVNRFYGKNNATKDVKAHHYIISFAPEDNITMQEAMDFGKNM